MKKSIIIIGSGMGGLATGIYGQRNGFDTTIFETHSKPGGQCTSWERKGYTFDPSLHSLNGFKPQTKSNTFWKELGAMPCEMVNRNEFVSAAFPDGTFFHNYFDLEKLQAHLNELSPADASIIDEYINGLKSFVTDSDLLGTNYFGSFREKLSMLPHILPHLLYYWKSLKSSAAMNATILTWQFMDSMPAWRRLGKVSLRSSSK